MCFTTSNKAVKQQQSEGKIDADATNGDSTAVPTSYAHNYFYRPETFVRIMKSVGFVDARAVFMDKCPEQLNFMAAKVQPAIDRPFQFFIVASRPI